MSVIRDGAAWVQRGLQAIGKGVAVRWREEPVITVALFRAAVTTAVGFGLGWSGEQVALTVLLFEALTAFVSRQSVTPNARVALVEGELPEPYVGE